MNFILLFCILRCCRCNFIVPDNKLTIRHQKKGRNPYHIRLVMTAPEHYTSAKHCQGRKIWVPIDFFCQTEKLLKETVSRDFLPLVFFVKYIPLGHCFTLLSVFANNFEFTEIFEFKVDSAVSMTPLSQKNFLIQPPFFKVLPQRRRVVKFTLAWIFLDCLFKKMRAFKNSKIDSAVSLSLLTQRCQ